MRSTSGLPVVSMKLAAAVAMSWVFSKDENYDTLITNEITHLAAEGQDALARIVTANAQAGRMALRQLLRTQKGEVTQGEIEGLLVFLLMRAQLQFYRMLELAEQEARDHE